MKPERMRVMTILGTRPEIIRLSEVIKACDRHFNHKLVHTGQNWDASLNEVFFRDLGLRKPDIQLNVVGEHLGATMGQVIEKTYEVLERERPEALLVLGDTNSALSVIGAKRLKIPIFHMEAGNRCFDFNVPEEINRRIVDHVSDVNLAYTEHARRYLLDEGLPGHFIFVTGSPMREVLKVQASGIAQSDVLERMGLQKGKFFVLSAHREENLDIGGKFASLVSSIQTIAEAYQLPIVFSVHPRTAKKIKDGGVSLNPLVKMMTPLGFHDYIRLQQDSQCVLSDSGTLSEESAILGFPGVLLRTSTERPEALDAGSVVVGGVESAQVLGAIRLAIALRGSEICPDDYKVEEVSSKVVKLITSCTPMVRRDVWQD